MTFDFLALRLSNLLYTFYSALLLYNVYISIDIISNDAYVRVSIEYQTAESTINLENNIWMLEIPSLCETE